MSKLLKVDYISTLKLKKIKLVDLKPKHIQDFFLIYYLLKVYPEIQ